MNNPYRSIYRLDGEARTLNMLTVDQDNLYCHQTFVSWGSQDHGYPYTLQVVTEAYRPGFISTTQDMMLIVEKLPASFIPCHIHDIMRLSGYTHTPARNRSTKWNALMPGDTISAYPERNRMEIWRVELDQSFSGPTLCMRRGWVHDASVSASIYLDCENQFVFDIDEVQGGYEGVWLKGVEGPKASVQQVLDQFYLQTAR